VKQIEIDNKTQENQMLQENLMKQDSEIEMHNKSN